MSSGDHFFLGLTVEQGGRVGRIPYLDIRRESLLEYDLVQALSGLSRQSTPKVAIVSPLLPSSAALAEREGLSFMAELKRAYDVAVVPFFKTEIPAGIDVVILMGADILHEDMLYSIDQFVMAGGSLIVMMDPFSRVKRANNVTNPSPSEEINDISDLLARYGIVYEGDAVVGDAQLASIVSDADQGRLNYPYWMRITGSDLSADHATTANLNEVLLVEPGAFRLEGSARALVTTTDDAGSALRGDFDRLTPRDLSMSFASQSKKRVLAATVQGPLKSAFGSAPDFSTAAAALRLSLPLGALRLYAYYMRHHMCSSNYDAWPCSGGTSCLAAAHHSACLCACPNTFPKKQGRAKSERNWYQFVETSTSQLLCVECKRCARGLGRAEEAERKKQSGAAHAAAS